MFRPVRMTTLGYVALIVSSLTHAQAITVSARTELITAQGRGKTRQWSNVLIWLTPLAAAVTSPPVPSVNPPRLTQHNKSFSPHLLVVPVGSSVEFPNRDPFFHNVFSLFEGKRFDLGLYEAGTNRSVRFDKPGISYIFCNIHAEMSAVVVALTTPYYGISNLRGEISIPQVPPGRYLVRVWYETALPEALDALTHEITVSPDRASLGLFRIPAATLPPPHKNKYGTDYNPLTPSYP